MARARPVINASIFGVDFILSFSSHNMLMSAEARGNFSFSCLTLFQFLYGFQLHQIRSFFCTFQKF